jgi:2,3,4,5-tetrahydropyridine-2-carboxylate N-succinyltransferase
VRLIIDELWSARDTLNEESLKEPEIKKAILDTIDELDNGKIKIANKKLKDWEISFWVKQAILLYIKVSNTYLTGVTNSIFFDKIPLKFNAWNQLKFEGAGIRISPNSVIQKGVFLSKNTYIKGAFIEIGSYIGEGTVIDPFTYIGACSQIGSNVKISSNVHISQSLEPISLAPTIIEDNCVISSRCTISEGVIIREGSVIGCGVEVSKHTKVYDKETDTMFYGELPPYSLAVSGAIPSDDGKSLVNGIIILKRLDSLDDKEIQTILKGHR